MKNPIKNRCIFSKIMLYAVAICLIVATASCISACDKKKYDENTYTIAFTQKNAVFTLPKDAQIRVDKKVKNYVYEQIAPKKKKYIGDMAQYVFENNCNQTFRIEREGYVTRAGYFEQEGDFEIEFNQNENICERVQYASTLPFGLAGVDDIMLTNVGDNYFKVLDTCEKFDLRMFRNTMIVDNYTSNTQIEPNFNFEILSGDSVIIDKRKENIFEVTAQKNGVTKIKFSYQAIEVLNQGKLFRYNASDESRDVVITFAVGSEYAVDIPMKINGRDFDSEFDTVYFEGESGEIKFEVEGASSVVCNGKLIEGYGNTYILQIVKGYNYIAIEKDNKRTFVTIYGAKIDIKIENNIDNLSVGDKVKLDLNGVYTAIPKLSGIYNPTQNHSFGDTPTIGSRLQLIMANGDILLAEYQSQYYSEANCKVEFVLKEEYLVNGKLIFDMAFCYEWWGDDIGSHRQITANGVENNLNAILNKKEVGFFFKTTI